MSETETPPNGTRVRSGLDGLTGVVVGHGCASGWPFVRWDLHKSSPPMIVNPANITTLAQQKGTDELSPASPYVKTRSE